ncbi:MAG: threonine aldolase family protein [Acidimicrobiales bacterium]|nr:threonine aldolase family protein [Acidimicrobiales bacterium]
MPDPRGRVDLRSDTVTRPTVAMREAMAAAEVGDDGFGDDPTVRRLEAAFAELVGKDAGLFVPSGTMANQIALRALGRPGTVVLCGRRQHVVVREVAAAGTNTAVQLVTFDDDDGTVDPGELVRWQADAQQGWAPPSAIFVEDTHGEAGGRVWPLERLHEVAAIGLPVHLDGARLWNAAVASGASPAERAAPATLVTACLSKGLGAPVGSVMAASADLVALARLERKRLGGTMRQVGILAAAGLVALDRIDRLADDHVRARTLAEGAARRWPGSVDPELVDTNIVRVEIGDPAPLLAHLAAAGVLAVSGSATSVRFVTHADVDDADVERALAAIADGPEPT